MGSQCIIYDDKTLRSFVNSIESANEDPVSDILKYKLLINFLEANNLKTVKHEIYNTNTKEAVNRI